MALVLLAFSLVCLAKTTKLTGKIVAYDVMKHASKSAAAVQNEEVVILETTGQKQKYVKIVFSSVGTTQIEQKYFDGTVPLAVEVLRDHTCDEKAPALVAKLSMEQVGGNYLLTDAFKAQPPAKIKTLVCYAAIYRKK